VARRRGFTISVSLFMSEHKDWIIERKFPRRRVENSTFLRSARDTIMPQTCFHVDSGIIRNNNSDKTRIVRAIPTYRGRIERLIGNSQSFLMKIIRRFHTRPWSFDTNLWFRIPGKLQVKFHATSRAISHLSLLHPVLEGRFSLRTRNVEFI